MRREEHDGDDRLDVSVVEPGITVATPRATVTDWGFHHAQIARIEVTTLPARRDGWLDAAPRLEAWSRLPPPVPGLACVVVMPARNEAEHVALALRALAAQVGAPRFEVVLLANNCDDDTAAIARRVARGRSAVALHVVEVRIDEPDAHIGYVRRELMNEATRRLRRAGSSEDFIASTDADTIVAPDWLAASAAELARGAGAVGGRITVDGRPAPQAQALRLRRLDEAHALLRCRVASIVDPDPVDPWPNHHQHFGASLAVRADAYTAAGGVPDVRFLEDDALVRAVERAGYAVRRSPRVRVRTSARLDGRATVGLSWQLRQWAERDGGDDPRVESADDFVAAMRVRARLRRAWPDVRGDLGEPLGIDAMRWDRLVSTAASFGAAWQAIDEERCRTMTVAAALVPRSVAMRGLREWLRLARPGTRPDAAPDQPRSNRSSLYCG